MVISTQKRLFELQMKQPKNWVVSVSESKTGCGNPPQTFSLAFLVDSSGVIQLKNTGVSLEEFLKSTIQKIV